MKQIDVYVITKDIRYETEAESEVKAFGSLEEAKTELQVMCKVYRDDAKQADWTIETDDDMAFEAFKMGDECVSHYYFQITHHQINVMV